MLIKIKSEEQFLHRKIQKKKVNNLIGALNMLSGHGVTVITAAGVIILFSLIAGYLLNETGIWSTFQDTAGMHLYILGALLLCGGTLTHLALTSPPSVLIVFGGIMTVILLFYTICHISGNWLERMSVRIGWIITSVTLLVQLFTQGVFDSFI